MGRNQSPSKNQISIINLYMKIKFIIEKKEDQTEKKNKIEFVVVDFYLKLKIQRYEIG